MDYQTKLNEVRYRTNTVNQYDTNRMSTLRRLETRRTGGVMYTWRRMWSTSPFMLIPGGYTLAYAIGFQTYSTVEAMAWYALLMLGLVGPLMLWLGVFGIFQKLRDNTRFGLGWVVFGTAPVAIGIAILAVFLDHVELDLKGIFDEARAGRDNLEAVRWAVSNRYVPLATAIGFGIGLLGGVALLVQGVRRHTADVAQGPQPMFADE